VRATGGEACFTSERRFQMGSMGDGGGETSTLTAAEHDDIDDWLCWASSGVW